MPRRDRQPRTWAPPTTEAVTRQVALGYRNRGYAAGLSGRDPSRPDDPNYMDGYRRGKQRRAQVTG